MIVILTGAPGAGKGTQADLLASRRGFKKLSTGDALRKHVRLGTPVGKVAGSVMEKVSSFRMTSFFRFLAKN